MRYALLAIAGLCSCLTSTIVSAETDEAPTSDVNILRSYAEDYQSDPFFDDPIYFGIKVGEAWYNVIGTPAQDGGDGLVQVSEGAPENPTYYFVIESSKVLRKLDAEAVSALTLAGKASSSDYAPMDIALMDGAELPEWFGDKITRQLFHFWTKGWPEIVPFATQETREVHSSDLAALYYQPGFRSAYFDMQPGRHANDGEGEEAADPYTSMFILLKGELSIILDDEEFTVTEGNMFIVPPNVRHELINIGEQNAQGFLMMFGEGA